MRSSETDSGVSQAVVELRIGPDKSSTDVAFGRLSDVAATSNGTIFTADWQAVELRRFDAEGRSLGLVGGVGEGPGEYTQLAEIEALTGDRVAVWPAGGGRMLVYRADGTFVHSILVPSSLLGQRMLEAELDGSVVVLANDPDRAVGEDWADKLIRIDPAGEVTGEVALPVAQSSQAAFGLSRPEGFLENFAVQALHAWSPAGYLVEGRNDEYRLLVHAPGGDLVIARDVAPVALEPDERELWLAWAEFFAKRPRTGFEVGERPTYTVPEIKPFFREIRIDDAGRIWVHRYVRAELLAPPPPARGGTPGLAWRERPTFDVFSPAGLFLGTVRLPHFTSFTQARGDILWGIQADAEDEHWVVRMRIEPPLDQE